MQYQKTVELSFFMQVIKWNELQCSVIVELNIFNMKGVPWYSNTQISILSVNFHGSVGYYSFTINSCVALGW